MTIPFVVILIVISLAVVLVSFVHLLCRESLRVRAREPESLTYFKQTLLDRLGMDGEAGATAFSLIRHFGLLALAIVTMAMTLMRKPPLWAATIEAFGVSTVLMLITSYLAPRFLFRRTSGAWALAFMGVARGMAAAFRPVLAMLDFLQNIADLGENGTSSEEKATAEEHIEALIEAGKEEGILEEKDKQLIQSVVAFNDKTVREVMTPRPNIVAVAADTPLETLRDLVIHEQYSRIPVYDGSIDNLVGFVHVRDMFELDESERANRTVRSIMRNMRCVPESKPVNDLLREMQSDSVHMVGVVDEYGNTAGVATLEDLVEEILGEIRDEHEPGEDAVPRDDGSYDVAGNYDLDHLKQLVDFTPEGAVEATTVGGLVTEWLGHVPKVGEKVARSGIEMVVLAGNDRRVERVRVSRLNGTNGG